MRHRKWASARQWALVGLLVSVGSAAATTQPDGAGKDQPPFVFRGDQVPQAIRAASVLSTIAGFAASTPDEKEGRKIAASFVEHLGLASKESRACSHLLDLAEELSAARESRLSDFQRSVKGIGISPQSEARLRMAQDDMRVYNSGYAGEVIGRWLAEREAEGASADELFRRLVDSATVVMGATSKKELYDSRSRFRGAAATEFEVRLTEALGRLPRPALESPARREDDHTP